MLETRSTEGSVEKKFIDEINDQRKLAGIPGTTPAVLLINNDMIIHDVAKRAAAGIPDEVVNHAKDRNVLIIRTIDLLMLMRQLEQDSHREKKMAHLLVSGGGWHKTAGP